MFSFLQDEDVYSFFEPELPVEPMGTPRSKVTEAIKLATEKRSSSKLLPSGRSSNASGRSDKKSTGRSSRRASPENSSSWSVLDLKKENYFSCAVGRTRTNARYLINTSDDVVTLLKEIAEAASFSNGSSSSQ